MAEEALHLLPVREPSEQRSNIGSPVTALLKYCPK